MDHPTFEELTHRHYAEVVRAAFLIGADRQEALDVAQETFARAFERWRQISRMENQVGWLIRVATNLALSNRRRVARADRLLSTPSPVTDTPSDPSMAKALGTLTPAQRAAIVLRFYLDLSIEDTARALGKRPGTVRALTAQGVARLREHLGAEWLEVRDD